MKGLKYPSKVNRGCSRHGGTLPLRDGTLRDGTAVEDADADDAATSALAFAVLMSLCTCDIRIFTLGLLGGALQTQPQ